MEKNTRIQRTLDYIEENLRADLTARELAELAGYSQYHYSRLFRMATGMSVGHYILRRRLLHGGYAIARGGSGIDTALAYGFDTYAGFYRASSGNSAARPRNISGPTGAEGPGGSI